MEIRWVERLIGDATNEAIGASMIMREDEFKQHYEWVNQQPEER